VLVILEVVRASFALDELRGRAGSLVTPTAWSLVFAGLAPDDVVNLQELRLAWVYPDLLQQRHEALPEGVHLLLRVPDLANSDVSVRQEADVVVQAVWRPLPFFKTANRLVVLLKGADLGVKRARTLMAILHVRVGPTLRLSRGRGAATTPPDTMVSMTIALVALNL